MSARKGGLGRGLDALIPQSVIPTEIKTSSGVITANRDEIELSNIALIQNNQELILMRINYLS
jgi:ParB family transcriptional regulator, chromosome partitioning protein